MSTLRVLLVQHAEEDTQLILRELRRGGIDPISKRVDTSTAMSAALEKDQWDVIISGFSLPLFSGLGALDLLKARQLDIPFIIVSGTIGEDTAVATMKAGAHDYVMKQNLTRLAAAVERECREARVRAERRRAEKAVQEGAVLYRSLVDLLPDGVGIVDLNAEFALCNERMASMHGYGLDELLGKAGMHIFAPEDHARVREAFSRLRDAGGVHHFELTMARKDGTRFPAEFSATAILDEKEKPKAFVVVIRDITDRKQIQTRLMAGDRMASLGMVAAGVAHEINNPLSYILANLASVDRQLADHLRAGGPLLKSRPIELPVEFLSTLAQVAESRDALTEAMQGAERVRAIVRDFKAVSRDDEAQLGPVDLRQVLESSIRMASNEIRHRARLVKDFAESPPVEGNDGRLGQVFLNLLVNAAQAIPEGAAQQNEVRVAIHTDSSGRAVVSISDTGQGIPPELRRRVFDPFFTTKPIGIDNGMGLSISKGIVEALGGELTFESEVGRGTTFHVALPASLPAAKAVHLNAVSSSAGRRGRILVVDDDPFVGRAVRRILSPPHEVVCLTNGREALERLKAGERFDLVLSDLLMPEMSGMDLYHELQSIAPALSEEMVFFTGGAFTTRAKSFLHEVPNARLGKPFEIDRLKALVNDRLRSSS